MKKFMFFAWLVSASFYGQAQSVAINTDKSAASSSAILDVKSYTKGILIPRTSSASRNAIPNPAKGLMIYDTTANNFWFHNGNAWTQLSGNSNNWSLSGNTGINGAVNFIGTTNQQPLRFRTNNQWSGEINPAHGSVFLGSHASNDTATGFYNIGIGDHSLFLNSNGSYNTAAGVSALYSNTSGNVNTAVGAYALTLNSTGSNNTAIGNNALNMNTTGYDNTAVGSNALKATTTGYYNTAVGSLALVSNTTGIYNNASGYRALYSNTTGGSNDATGAGALFSNTTGLYNTANGAAAMFYGTTGSYNTASGAQALYNNAADNNTADGALALAANTTGTYNTATGVTALGSNNTGYNNSATGALSLSSNRTGFYNTAMGFRAMYYNIGGYENTAFGGQALYFNNNGIYNSAFGINALYSNSDGTSNTALGEKALFSSTTGGNNTAVGIAAFYENLTGTGITALGANTTLNGWTNLVNATAIGYAAVVDDHNKVRIGNANVLSIGGHVGWTTFSDGRFKQQVKEDVKGLEFIMSLRPVTYTIDLAGLNNYQQGKQINKDDIKNNVLKASEIQSMQRAATHRESGFIAQEVEQVAMKTGFTFSGVDKPGNDRALYGLRYADFVVPLVKAMQQQQSFIETLQQQVNALRSESSTQPKDQSIIIADQQKQIDLLEKRLAALEKKL